MYLNKMFPIALSFILLSSASKAMIEEKEDNFGRRPDHPNYQAPFSEENTEDNERESVTVDIFNRSDFLATKHVVVGSEYTAADRKSLGEQTATYGSGITNLSSFKPQYREFVLTLSYDF